MGDSSNTPTPNPLLCARELIRSFDRGSVQALRGVNLDLPAGGLAALIGPSGCGKSTLLQILGALDRPDRGELLFDGKPVFQQDLPAFRAREIGFIFQSFHLIPTLTALENVQIPMLAGTLPTKERRQRALDLLESVGLSGRGHHIPTRLSGGERQRVAVARSLANRPRLLLADEPTGNLDSQNSARILDLLFDVHDTHGTAMIIVTHDPVVARRVAERGTVFHMLDGVVTTQAREETP